MAIFAVGNPVSNVLVADSLNTAESVTNEKCYEVTEENPIQIGWYLNAETGIWEDPSLKVVTNVEGS